MKTDAEIINFILTITNLNKNQLAVKTGFNNGFITRWTNGDKGITLQSFLKIMVTLTEEQQKQVNEFMLK